MQQKEDVYKRQGLQKGVEKITKKMMLLLLALMVILAIRSATLPGAGEGIRFYLLPDFKKAAESGMKEVIFAAMGQSFFTLSLGIGAIAIFGSYIDKKRRLTGEAVCVTIPVSYTHLVTERICFTLLSTCPKRLTREELVESRFVARPSRLLFTFCS